MHLIKFNIIASSFLYAASLQVWKLKFPHYMSPYSLHRLTRVTLFPSPTLKEFKSMSPFYKTTLKLRFNKRSISNLTLSTFFQFKFLLYSKIKLKSALQDIQTFLFFDIIIHIVMLKIKSNNIFICINQFLITFWSSTIFSCWTSHPEDSIKTFDF